MRAFIQVLCGCACLLAGAAHCGEAAEGILVTPSWLADHLQDPSLVVLHVANLRADYDRGHIAGARFLWLPWMAESTPEKSVELPSVETLDKLVERLGISNDSRVVLCHVLGDVMAAARVYVTLDHLGLGDRTVILDGGLEAWKAEGRPVTREVPKFRRGTFTPRIKRDVIVDLAYVTSNYRRAGVRMVDGRSPQAFNAGDGIGVVRGGHIPGAINIPSSAVTDSADRYLPLDSLRTRFTQAGVRPGEEIITYCNVGRAACPVFVAAKMLGLDVRLYDGSFEEWSRQMDLPVEGKGVK